MYRYCLFCFALCLTIVRMYLKFPAQHLLLISWTRCCYLASMLVELPFPMCLKCAIMSIAMAFSAFVRKISFELIPEIWLCSFHAPAMNSSVTIMDNLLEFQRKSAEHMLSMGHSSSIPILKLLHQFDTSVRIAREIYDRVVQFHLATHAAHQCIQFQSMLDCKYQTMMLFAHVLPAVNFCQMKTVKMNRLN